jgi:hypothetical protein
MISLCNKQFYRKEHLHQQLCRMGKPQFKSDNVDKSYMDKTNCIKCNVHYSFVLFTVN